MEPLWQRWILQMDRAACADDGAGECMKESHQVRTWSPFIEKMLAPNWIEQFPMIKIEHFRQSWILQMDRATCAEKCTSKCKAFYHSRQRGYQLVYLSHQFHQSVSNGNIRDTRWKFSCHWLVSMLSLVVTGLAEDVADEQNLVSGWRDTLLDYSTSDENVLAGASRFPHSWSTVRPCLPEVGIFSDLQLRRKSCSSELSYMEKL